MWISQILKTFLLTGSWGQAGKIKAFPVEVTSTTSSMTWESSSLALWHCTMVRGSFKFIMMMFTVTFDTVLLR